MKARNRSDCSPVMDKVALGQTFLRAIFFIVAYHSTEVYILIHSPASVGLEGQRHQKISQTNNLDVKHIKHEVC